MTLTRILYSSIYIIAIFFFLTACNDDEPVNKPEDNESLPREESRGVNVNLLHAAKGAGKLSLYVNGETILDKAPFLDNTHQSSGVFNYQSDSTIFKLVNTSGDTLLTKGWNFLNNTLREIRFAVYYNANGELVSEISRLRGDPDSRRDVPGISKYQIKTLSWVRFLNYTGKDINFKDSMGMDLQFATTNPLEYGSQTIKADSRDTTYHLVKSRYYQNLRMLQGEQNLQKRNVMLKPNGVYNILIVNDANGKAHYYKLTHRAPNVGIAYIKVIYHPMEEDVLELVEYKPVDFYVDQSKAMKPIEPYSSTEYIPVFEGLRVLNKPFVNQSKNFPDFVRGPILDSGSYNTMVVTGAFEQDGNYFAGLYFSRDGYVAWRDNVIHNQDSAQINLNTWIDFNKNGYFDSFEFILYAKLEGPNGNIYWIDNLILERRSSSFINIPEGEFTLSIYDQDTIKQYYKNTFSVEGTRRHSIFMNGDYQPDKPAGQQDSIHFNVY